MAQQSDEQQTDAETGSDSDEPLDRVVVSASRIQGDDLFGSIPVVEVSREEFQFSGSSNVEDVLNTMPQLTPGLTSASGSITEGDGTATADLRGLGAQRTLVLVNGRRWMFADAEQIADLNTIPAALIERVELVTGGSSAVHGSDAISGVVNFILRDDFDGAEISAKFGQSFRGEGDDTDINVTIGGNFAGGRGNAVFSFNYFDRDGVKATERGFSSQALTETTDPVTGETIIVPAGGISSSIPQGRVFGLLPADQDFEEFPGLDSALRNAGLGNLGSLGLLFENGGQRPFDGSQDRFDFRPFDNLQIPLERWTFSTLTHFDLNDRFTAYAEGIFNNSQSDVPIAPALVFQDIRLQTDNPFVSPEFRNVLAELDAIDDVRGGQPNDGLVQVRMARRLLETGDRVTGHDRDAWKVTGGIRGDLPDVSDTFFRNVSTDVYYSFARTQNTLSRQGVSSMSRFSQGLLLNDDGTECLDPSGGCVPINPFGANNISAEAADFLSVEGAGGNSNSELEIVNGSLTAEVVELPAGWINVALGGEYRSAEAQFTPDPLTAIGDVIGFSAAAPATSGEIDVWELFAEARVPLVSDQPFMESLALNAAGRFSDYDIDSVDTVWTFGGGLDWRVNDSLAIRAQFQRAIRAPNLLELFAPVSSGIAVIDDPCADPAAAEPGPLRDTCIGTGVPESLAGNPDVSTTNTVGTTIGGNPNLQEEEGDTWTFGLMLTPSTIPNLSLTLDFYTIDLEDAVGQFAGGAANAVDLCFNVIQNPNAPACRAINRDPNTGAIEDSDLGVDVRNVNLSGIETRGVDFGINYGLELGWGFFGSASTVDFSLNGTYLDKWERTPVPDLPDQTEDCEGAFGSICGEPLPEWKFTSRATWRQGPLDLSLRWRLIDSVTDDRIQVGGRDRSEIGNPSLSTQHYIDLTGALQLTESYSFEVGVLNVFDNSPPVTVNSISANSRLNTFDPLGTQYFVRATAQF